jgi:hypothetical protein
MKEFLIVKLGGFNSGASQNAALDNNKKSLSPQFRTDKLSQSIVAIISNTKF